MEYSCTAFFWCASHRYLPPSAAERKLVSVMMLMKEAHSKVLEADELKSLTKGSVYKILLVFVKVFDKMDAEDKHKLIQNMILDVQLYQRKT